MPQEVTYQQLVDALQTKYNSLAIAKQLKNSIESANYNANNTNTNNYSSSNAYLNMAAVVEPGKHYSEQKVHYVHNLSSSNNNSRIFCKNCHKPGHTKENCWLLKTCELCGKKGHVGRYCPDNENGTAEINAALNSVSIKNSKKDKVKGKEVNPQKSFRHKFPKK
jgi:ribosomal protein L37AE/L43A